jgi:hypothetical protein
MDPATEAFVSHRNLLWAIKGSRASETFIAPLYARRTLSGWRVPKTPRSNW